MDKKEFSLKTVISNRMLERMVPASAECLVAWTRVGAEIKQPPQRSTMCMLNQRSSRPRRDVPASVESSVQQDTQIVTLQRVP